MMSEHTDRAAQESQVTSAMPGDVDPDLMIDDLPYQDAKAYVIQFLTAEKKTEKLLQERQQALNTWT